MSDKKRRIYIPDTVTVGKAEQEVPYDDFIDFLLNVYQPFNSTGEGLRASVRIDAAYKNARKEEGEVIEKPREYFDLEDKDWRMLKEAANNPGVIYPIRPARTILPYIDSIEDAEVVKE